MCGSVKSKFCLLCFIVSCVIHSCNGVPTSEGTTIPTPATTPTKYDGIKKNGTLKFAHVHRHYHELNTLELESTFEQPERERKFYLQQLFSEYGTNGVMNFEQFKVLLKNIGLEEISKQGHGSHSHHNESPHDHDHAHEQGSVKQDGKYDNHENGHEHNESGHEHNEHEHRENDHEHAHHEEGHEHEHHEDGHTFSSVDTTNVMKPNTSDEHHIDKREITRPSSNEDHNNHSVVSLKYSIIVK